MKNLLLACALLLAACGPSQELLNTQATLSVMQTDLARPTIFPDTVTIAPNEPPTTVPTKSIAPSATTRPTEVPTATTANGQTGVVTHIVDGDTIDVDIAGQVFRVRYIGIDTPERGDPCFADATQANSIMVLNKTVQLVKDVSETDRFDRLLRYVYVGDTFVNAELVENGYAVAKEYKPDIAQADYLEGLETLARNANLTCHAAGAFGGVIVAATSTKVIVIAATATQAVVIADTATSAPLPTQAPLPTEAPPTLPPPPPTEAPPPANCDPSYPTVCIPPAPPDLDCGDISFRRFEVRPPDPHNFDGNHDGVGCESG